MKNRDIDPILEEVDEMRRRIMAEHGNDWEKVLDHYVEVGKQQRNPPECSEPAEQGQSVA